MSVVTVVEVAVTVVRVVVVDNEVVVFVLVVFLRVVVIGVVVDLVVVVVAFSVVVSPGHRPPSSLYRHWYASKSQQSPFASSQWSLCGSHTAFTGRMVVVVVVMVVVVVTPLRSSASLRQSSQHPEGPPQLFV